MFAPSRFALAYRLLMARGEDNAPDGPRLFGEPIPIVLFIAVLAAVVLVCAAAIAPALWSVVTELAGEPQPTLQDCSAIKAEPARVACYDAYAARNRTRPAKGGEAPLIKPGS